MPMNSKVIEELGKRLDEEYVRSYSTDIKKSARKRLLGTLFFNFHELKSKFPKNLEPFALVGIEQRMNQISDWLTQEAFSHFFGNLYLIERSRYYNNRPELQNRLNWSIGDLYTAHILVLSGNTLSDSLGSTFLERLKELVSADCKIIDNKDPEFLKLALLNVCTANSVLTDYVDLTNADTKQKNLAKEYMRQNFDSLKKAFVGTEKTDETINLLLYIYLNILNIARINNENVDNLRKDYEDIVRLLEMQITNMRTYNVVLSLCDLYYLDKEKFRALFEKVFDDISTKVNWENRPFYIRILMRYLQDIKIGTEFIPLKIHPDFEPLDVDETIRKLFPEYFSNKNPPTVSNSDLEALMNYDDSEIRAKLASIFQKSQYISKNQKEQLTQEASKPHTGGEISDFEVSIGEDLYKTVYACLPIKSGREIKPPSVPETYAYQIMKPFIHMYNQCVVIFVTARRCSQALDAYVKKLKALYGFPITVIQEKYLCSILKFYGQL